MEGISPEELDVLETNELVSRMDEILSSQYWGRRGNDILKLSVRSLYDSAVVKRFSPEFQRKVVYKTFGFLLQLQYTDFSISASFFNLPAQDRSEATQIYAAARTQWTTISSRIVFEYFMHLTYMIGTESDFNPKKSAIKRYKTWLKKRDNPYTYFAINVARAMHYDRTKRFPEVHAATKLARRILLLSADNIDDSLLELINIMKNQWQFVLSIANEQQPNGWAASGNVNGDKEWYDLWDSKDYDAIDSAIDEMFPSS